MTRMIKCQCGHCEIPYTEPATTLVLSDGVYTEPHSQYVCFPQYDYFDGPIFASPNLPSDQSSCEMSRKE